MIASVIFVLDKKTDWISAPHALVYFGIVIFLVYFKVKHPWFSILDSIFTTFCLNFSYLQSCWVFMIPSCHSRICSALLCLVASGIVWPNYLVTARSKRKLKIKSPTKSLYQLSLYFIYFRILQNKLEFIGCLI